LAGRPNFFMRVTIRIPQKLYEKLKDEADARDMRVNAYIVAILEDNL